MISQEHENKLQAVAYPVSALRRLRRYGNRARQQSGQRLVS
jgi:hypothetical protein